MSVLRQSWVLILGVVVVVLGVVSTLLAPPTASFGWTAYAPLTSTTYTPGFPGIGLAEFGNVLFLLGAILIAAWVGFRIGRRAQSNKSAS